MKCYHYLKLPFEFKPCKFPPIKIHVELEIKNHAIDADFKNWLASLGLECDIPRMLIATPQQQYTIHRDSSPEYGCVKINFIYNSDNANMIWYKIKSNSSVKTYVNTLGETVEGGYTSDDLDILDQGIIDTVSLVNAHELHSVHNGNTFRQCYSFALKHINTEQRITWEEAEKIFQPYFT
jgi:hypothetical protein